MAVPVTAAKTAAMTAWRDLIDAGAGPGKVMLYTSAYGTLLAECVLSDPCGTVTGGELVFSVPAADSGANATGTVAIARIVDSTGTVVFEGITVGLSGASPEIVVASTSITSGQPVSITALKIAF